MIISQNIFVPVKPQQNVLQDMGREQLETEAVCALGRAPWWVLAKEFRIPPTALPCSYSLQSAQSDWRGECSGVLL